MTDLPGPWVEQWLSEARFSSYLSHAEGDRAQALALYEWNTEVSSAFLHDLAHLEVGLRNAYDRALIASTPPGRPHWVYDGHYTFPPVIRAAKNGKTYDAHETARRELNKAIGKARGDHGTLYEPPPGKVLAELTFAFWRHLSTATNDRLWRTTLRHGFQPGTGRKYLHQRVDRIYLLRNRVAHHEPLLRANLDRLCDDIRTVAAAITPPLQDYLDRTSRCRTVLARRP